MDEYVAFFGVIPNIWSKFKNAFESKIFSEKTVNKCQVIELFVHLWELQRPSACQDSETAGPHAGILILLAVGEILAGYALAVDIPVISG